MKWALLMTVLYLAIAPCAAFAQEPGPPGEQPEPAEAKVNDAAPVQEFNGEAILEMETENPTVGDTVTYMLTVRLDAGWGLEVPGNLNFAQGFRPKKDEVSIRSKGLEDGTTEVQLRIPFVIVRIGRLKLPERTFDAKGPAGEAGLVRAGKVVVTTGSMFASENEPEPGTPIGPLPVVERNWVLIWALAILAVFLVAVLVTLFVVSRLRTGKTRPGPPPVPAHIQALGRLDELVRLELEMKGEFTRFYTELSAVLREYLGGRFEFDSMDMTTTELTDRMQRVKLEHFLFEKLTYVLADFDLVKFAKVVPSQTQAGEDLGRVRELVMTTMPRDNPPPSDTGPAKPETAVSATVEEGES